MTPAPANELLLQAVIDSGSRAIAAIEQRDLTDPSNQPYLFEAALAVIAAGSAARDLRVGDETFSRLIQARDKLAHVYWIDEIVPRLPRLIDPNAGAPGRRACPTAPGGAFRSLIVGSGTCHGAAINSSNFYRTSTALLPDG